MTQGQVIQMLRKIVAENQNFTTWTVSTPHLVALVNHAIEAERESCAKACEEEQEYWGWDKVIDAAKIIRARGEA